MDIHPAIIHFPLVLFPASVVFDTVAILCCQKSLHRIAFAVWSTATLLCIPAVFTGNNAASEYWEIFPISKLIERHEYWATVCLFLALGITFFRFKEHLVLYENKMRTYLLVLCSSVLSVLVWFTGYLGAQLVYEYGVGVGK